MTPTTRQAPALLDLADRLHSGAIRLLRGLRAEDRASGLPGPKASALSVLVFGGAQRLGALAAAEQVRAPTITRLVAALVRDGLVRLEPDPADRRARRAVATPAGRRLLREARARRVARLAAAIAGLPAEERELLARGAPLLLKVAARAAAGAEVPPAGAGRRRRG